MSDLWLIRHGQAGEVMGDYDRLSPRGFQQSAAAGQAWRHIAPLHQAWRGAMRRHAETAATFAENFGPMPIPTEDAGWNEFDHQSVVRAALATGMRPPQGGGRAAFFAFFLDAMGRWASGDHDADYAESYDAFQARVDAALDRAVAQLGSGESAVVFTSGGVISAICRRLLHLAPREAFRINTILANSGVTRLRVGPGLLSLATLNAHPHLDADPALFTLS